MNNRISTARYIYIGILLMLIFETIMVSIQYKEKTATLNELKEELAEQQEIAEKLEEKQAYQQTDEYVIDQARSKLGYSYENEIIFKEN